MKKYGLLFLMILMISLVSISCTQLEGSDEVMKTDTIDIDTYETGKEDKIIVEKKEGDQSVKDVAETAEEIETEDSEKEKQEVNSIDKNSDNNQEASISDKIPDRYMEIRKDNSGNIKEITYETKDYFGNKEMIQKPAYVYLPYGYDEEKNYNVLYLMHGIGGNEREWGMFSDSSTVKCIMDNLIYYGDIEPFIVVVPNGRSSVNYADTSSDIQSFYVFGQELRNDLIPYIDANFATYGEYKEEGYDLTVARKHRAMAGLSMGGMQTINIGLCENLDILSYFGAFSACPTTNTSAKIAECLSEFEQYEIDYFYNICGTADDIAWPSSTAAVETILELSDKLEDGRNYMWQEVSGGVHDFKVWYLGFYHFAQLVFQ